MKRVLLTTPQNFTPAVNVSGCYCEWQDKILLVKRHPDDTNGNTWGVPSGTMEKDETIEECVIREVKEEVSLTITYEKLKYVGNLCIILRKDFGFIYHMFRFPFSSCPNVVLDLKENIESKWVTIEDALKHDLIFGAKEAFLQYKHHLSF